jgi:gliding motility-associated-like protein
LKAFKILLLKVGLLALIGSPFFTFGSHMTGGKITYRYLGLNKYELKLTVYRDCGDNIDFDNPAVVTIFDKQNGSIVLNEHVALFTRDTLPANAPDPCFLPQAGICVEHATYIDTVLLLPNSIGYTATYQRFSRNSSILNLVLPQFYGITLTVDIPPQINNTPVSLNTPPIYVCLNDTLNYSFSATDNDGDNLVYQLCDPLIGGEISDIKPDPAGPPPYQPVIWKNGYSALNPISNTSGITMNSATGKLSFVPNLIGQFALGVCILEYRNGVLINTNRTELQINVVPCYLVSSIPTSTNICDGLTVTFKNSSTNANQYYWNFGDENTLADTSAVKTPTYTFPGYGTYTITLVAGNNSYSTCKDTSIQVVKINPALKPIIPPSYQSCFNGNNITFSVGGLYSPTATFTWIANDSTQQNNPGSNPNNMIFLSPTSKSFSVIVSQFGCSDTLQSVVNFTNPVANTQASNINCNGKNAVFGNFSENASRYFWDFGISNTANDTSDLQTPSFSYPSFGNFTVMLVAFSGACSDTMRIPVIIRPKLSLDPVSDLPTQCLENNSFSFTPKGVYTDNTNFQWVFDTTANVRTSTMQNPSNIRYSTPGKHVIKLTISEFGCVKNRTQMIKIYDNLRPSIFVSDTIGCEPLNVMFAVKPDTNLSNPLWVIDNSSYSLPLVNKVFERSGSYPFTLTTKDGNNCLSTIKKQVEVKPTPKARAYVTPLNSDDYNVPITFLDSSKGNSYTYFEYGDGTTSQNRNNRYNYRSAGIYDYKLIVSNIFGCSDTAMGTVKIEPFTTLYIPNSFTPNGDGRNDAFGFKGESILKSDLKIFDRWGRLLFESSNPYDNWDGNYKEEPCQDGVYAYRLEVTFATLRERIYEGSITLYR